MITAQKKRISVFLRILLTVLVQNKDKKTQKYQMTLNKNQDRLCTTFLIDMNCLFFFSLSSQAKGNSMFLET